MLYVKNQATQRIIGESEPIISQKSRRIIKVLFEFLLAIARLKLIKTKTQTTQRS